MEAEKKKKKEIYHICPSVSGLTSLSMTISRFPHVAANGIISFFFMAEYIYIYIFHCAYVPHLFFISLLYFIYFKFNLF